MKTNDYLIDKLIEDERYKIFPDGRILTRVARTGKTTSNWRVITYKLTEHGYFQINYCYKRLFVHRVVYRKFKGELNSELVINHIDGVKTNNDIKNLELVTQGQNLEHRFRVLKHPPNITTDKINFEVAEKIREDKKRGMLHKELAKKYEVSKTTISYVINNKIWKK